MPFVLKNAPSEFQNIMNSIFNHISNISIVYIDDVLIFCEDIDSHLKQLNISLILLRTMFWSIVVKRLNYFKQKS